MSADNQLIIAYGRSRSDEVFAQIVQRHHAMVLRTCLRTLGNREDSEDAAQSIFLTLSQNPTVVKHALAGWLHQAAQSTAKEIARARLRRAKHEEEATQMTTTDDERVLAELREELDDAIACLPDSLREAVILRHLEDWSREEAARIAGCTVQTITIRCNEGLARLRKILAKRTGKALSMSALVLMLAHEASASGPTMPLEKLQLATLLNLEPTSRVVALAKSVLKAMLWTKVKIIATVVMVSVFLSSGVVLSLDTYFNHPAEPALKSPISETSKPPIKKPLQSTLLRGHGGRIEYMVYSPDGHTLATIIADGNIVLWDMVAKKQRATLSGQGSATVWHDFSTDSERFASQSQDGTVRLWDVKTGLAIASFPGQHIDKTHPVAFSTDGKTLNIAGTNSIIQEVDAVTGRIKGTSRSTVGIPTTLVLSGDGLTLAVANDLGKVTLTDKRTGKVQHSFQAHGKRINIIEYTPGPGRLLTVSEDLTMKLWDPITAKLLFTLRGHDDAIASTSFTPDGWTLLSSSVTNCLKVWDLKTGQLKYTLQERGNPFQTGATSGDCKTIATVSAGQSFVKLWDVATGKLRGAPLQMHTATLSAIAFSPDSRNLTVASDEGSLEVWKLPPSRK